MLRIQKSTGLERSPEKTRRGAFSKTWFLITAIVIIALAGVTGNSAQSATRQSEENLLANGGGIVDWDDPVRVEDKRAFWNMSARSMVLDNGNFMHVAYGGDRLYHAYFNGSSWQTEIVDPKPYVGQYASIALKIIMGAEHIYISYYDSEEGSLKYAHRESGGAWDLYTVDAPVTTSAAGERKSVIKDIEDLPKIKPWINSVARVNGLDEMTEPSATVTGGVGQYSSISLDSEGNPHIAYYDADNQALKYASYNGVVWTTETVRQTATSYKEGKYAALYIDLADRPHISFLEDDHDNLRYTYKEGNNWRFAYPDTGGNVGGHTSIIVDSKYRVHISYCQGPLVDNFCVRLKYATALLSDSKPENWNWEKATLEGNYAGSYSSIAKSGNKLAISYYDWNNYKLRLATRDTKTDPVGTWDIQDFDFEGDHGLYTSIAFDNDGYIHIAFQDLQDGYYKEVYFDEEEDEYIGRNIDRQRDVGLFSSLALDSTNKAHISYADETADDLRYATNASGAWVTSVISATGIVGDYSSIALDSGNVPHVSFYDIEGGDLEYATLSGGSWITTTIDNTENKDDDYNTGLFSDITISPVNNLPYISYYDATKTNLMLANYNGTNWITYTVDGAIANVDVGKYSSIDMDNAGHIYISYFDENYYDGPTMRLKFAYWSGTSWMIRTVDYSENVGYYTSIDYDDSGRVHIAYYDAAKKALKYAQGVISGGDWVWTIETVDDINSANYDVGKYASIGVTDTGTPYISYYDAMNGDLKLANKPTNGRWIMQVIDWEGDVGRFTSLDIDSNNLPHISYYDNSLGDLKYLFGNSVSPIVAEMFSPNIIK